MEASANIVRVTRDDLAKGLRALGVGEGDVLFLHSSLSAFGCVEGGAGAAVLALLDVLGVGGTLAVPTFAQYFDEGPEQVWDRDYTPSRMGAITERVRTWPDAVRGHNATHPIAAVGVLARDLADRDNVTAWGFDSPFQRLIELNAWIVLAGVGWNTCTLVHLLEERAEVAYRFWQERTGYVVEGGVGRRKTYRCLTRYWGIKYDFEPLGQRLEAEGRVSTQAIGRSTVRAVRARDLYEVGFQALRQDPLFLVSQDTQEIARRYLPDAGAMMDAYGSRQEVLLEPREETARRLVGVLRVSAPPGTVAVEQRQHWETDDGLALDELRFSGGTNEMVPALLARPRAQCAARPAVLCLHGTGGTWEREMEPRVAERGSTLLGWARELARQGYVALAITQLNHPPRREPSDWREPRLLPLYGKTGMGRLVADALLSVEYLCSRPDVDPSRVAVAGFSLGGIVGFYTFAVDPRVAAAVTFCGGVGSVRELVRAGNTRAHSAYYYVPGLLESGLDHPSLVDAMAPRPLFVCGATDDVCMPASGYRQFCDAASQAYAARGAREAFGSLLEEGPHRFTRQAFQTAFAWLGSRL
ncbi:MAG: hypothetical protein GX557_02380 [Chloroflexi bacterium]|nr:hypothetical protein [Chloroflexota bacterium]